MLNCAEKEQIKMGVPLNGLGKTANSFSCDVTVLKPGILPMVVLFSVNDTVFPENLLRYKICKLLIIK